MVKKMQGPIVKVRLNEATFTDQEFDPTLVNFIYGKNGTGKTTISRILRNGKSEESRDVVWANSYVRDQYDILVFNQDFIRNNVELNPFMPGVFTLYQQNIELKHKIDAAKDEMTRHAMKKEELQRLRQEKKKNLLLAEEQHKEKLWFMTASIREFFLETEPSKMTQEEFLDRLAKTKGKEYALDELKASYYLIYRAVLQKQMPLEIPDIPFPEGVEVLSRPILGKNTSPLSILMNEMQSTDWVLAGYSRFHRYNNGLCPYCQQELSPDFRKQIEQCFENEYVEKIGKLNTFHLMYAKYVDQILTAYREVLTKSVIEDEKLYETQLRKLENTLYRNTKQIEAKKEMPYKSYALEDPSPLINSLNALIVAANETIRINNEIVDNREEKTTEFNTMLWEYLAWTVSADDQQFNAQRSALMSEIIDYGLKIENESENVHRLKGDIVSLSAQLLDTDSAVQNINELLQRVGFMNFYLQKKDHTADQYVVVRLDDTAAEGTLSEGERNFIAFLYFYELVRGGLQAQDAPSDKIVVVDDPVSSMDSDVMHLVSRLIRNMLENCMNNARPDKIQQGEDYIKQVFILTHNQAFHQMIAPDYEKEWRCASFYRIVKDRNESVIELMTRNDPEKPTELINLNPVKSPYVNLWKEYTEARKSNELITAAQKILASYFIQFCGCDGKDICDIVLKQNKDKFMPRDAFGRVNRTKLFRAEAMLAYFSTKGTGIADGFYYEDEFSNLTEAREVFEEIFRLTGNEAHYQMMMEQTK